MRKNYLLVFILLSSLCSAQVGIGTTNPQQELHISGTNATIRIEKLDDINSSTYNDGNKPASAYVDGYGDITVGSGTGLVDGQPINFLIEIPNFITDNPYVWTTPDEINNTGIVINNTSSDESVVGFITSIPFYVPQESLIEVKYGITLYAKGEDMSDHAPPYIDVAYGQTISMAAFFCIDLDEDGIINGSEYNKKYGRKGQFYETQAGGIQGFPYMNGQGYFTLPEGNYEIHFYGVVNDHELSYTSVGFGGLEDYLKIRIYN